MTHKLDIYPIFYNEVISENKKFELRRDRGFCVGDDIVLMELCPKLLRNTGRQVTKRISYIARGSYDYGLRDGFVVLSIDDIID